MILGTTPCGVRYAVRRSGSAVGYCALSIRCGTRDEEGFHGGIAHFTEHTLFKGTRRKRAATINSYLERLGGELNAYTTKEEIVIHATVLKEDLRKAGNLLFELATEATFPESEIETERGVVIEEIQSYKDSPADDVYDRFEEKLFAGHPLAQPILGTVASVKKIGSEELRRFVAEKFRPEVMAFTVVADVPEERLEKEVVKLIGKWFADAPAREPLTGHAPASGQVPAAVRFDQTLDKKNHEVNAVIGSLAPSLYEEKERLSSAVRHPTRFSAASYASATAGSMASRCPTPNTPIPASWLSAWAAIRPTWIAVVPPYGRRSSNSRPCPCPPPGSKRPRNKCSANWPSLRTMERRVAWAWARACFPSGTSRTMPKPAQRSKPSRPKTYDRWPAASSRPTTCRH